MIDKIEGFFYTRPPDIDISVWFDDESFGDILIDPTIPRLGFTLGYARPSGLQRVLYMVGDIPCLARDITHAIGPQERLAIPYYSLEPTSKYVGVGISNHLPRWYKNSSHT